MKKLRRPIKRRKVAGVCIGIANYLNVDVVVIRLLMVFLFLPGGLPGFFTYLISWIVIPKEE